MRKMLKLLKVKFSNYVHQHIIARYNYIDEGDAQKKHEAAAFLFFMDVVLNFFYAVFVLFAIVSFSLLFKYEILPLI